jgi:hypothetical protein
MFLEIYGVHVEVHGDETAVRSLGVHFGAFVAKPANAVSIRVELRRDRPALPSSPRLRADQVLERGIVYNQGELTWVDHHGVALTHYDFSRERGAVTAEDPNDLVELGYLMIHSRVGVLLEERGLVRVHALGVGLNGRAAVVLTPSGGGKSRLALAILKRTSAELLGDDVVLLDARGRAYPFPHPIGIPSPESASGLGPAAEFVRRQHPTKWLLELGDLGHRLAKEPHEVKVLALYRRVSAPPSRTAPASTASAAQALFRDLVVGLGLPQVLELVARRGLADIPGLLPVALGRARVAAGILKCAHAITLEVSDAETAAEVLVAELARH